MNEGGIMDIRKADAKGRVTGFEPGRYYEVSTPDDRSTAVLRLLATGGYVSGTGPVVGSTGCLFPGTPNPAGTVHEGEFIVTGYEKGHD